MKASESGADIGCRGAGKNAWRCKTVRAVCANQISGRASTRSAIANGRPARRARAVPRLRTISVIVLLASSTIVRAADGGEVFTAHCAPCHGLDGKARTPAGKKLGAKDLSESKLDDRAIEKQILFGVKDPKGSDRMPAFKERLATAEVAALVGFVKTFRPSTSAPKKL